MSSFSAAADHLSRHLSNYVACAHCGKTVHRNQYTQKRNKHSFCNHQCAAKFYNKQLKIVRSYRQLRDYNQQAYGVSMKLAQALKTGEPP